MSAPRKDDLVWLTCVIDPAVRATAQAAAASAGMSLSSWVERALQRAAAREASQRLFNEADRAAALAPTTYDEAKRVLVAAAHEQARRRAQCAAMTEALAGMGAEPESNVNEGGKT